MAPHSTPSAPPSGKEVAAAAFEAFGGDRRVRRVHHVNGSTFVDVLSCAGAPFEGWVSHSTLNLHQARNLVGGDDIRVEIAGIAAADIEGFENVLAEAGYALMLDGWEARPGSVIEGIVADCVKGCSVPHLLLCPPYAWDGLGRLDLADGGRVHWLLAFPISDAERQVLIERGFDALETLFGEQNTEYFDLYRASAV